MAVQTLRHSIARVQQHDRHLTTWPPTFRPPVLQFLTAARHTPRKRDMFWTSAAQFQCWPTGLNAWYQHYRKTTSETGRLPDAWWDAGILRPVQRRGGFVAAFKGISRSLQQTAVWLAVMPQKHAVSQLLAQRQPLRSNKTTALNLPQPDPLVSSPAVLFGCRL